jgi:hypothetical protein
MKKMNAKKEPELPGLAERWLTLPWMIINRTEGDNPDDLLLVSAPDGVVLELDIPKDSSDGLSLLLADSRFWNSVFSSSISALRINPPKKD